MSRPTCDSPACIALAVASTTDGTGSVRLLCADCAPVDAVVMS